MTTNLNQTPSANRTHIGIFGKRNAGKSSLINALTGQNLAIVSDVSGTTTDPVYKAMELKMKYKPLTPLQQEKYNSQKKAYEHPVVESEEAEEQQEEEAKAVEEAPENTVAESPEKDTDKGEDKEAETSILREEPKEVSTEDIAAKALAAVAETEEVPLTAEKKEAEEPEEEPAEKPHKRSGLRQSVKGATLAEALKKGMAVANGENPESKALNKSDEDLRVTGQMKIDDILQAWEAKQKDNAEAIEIQKKKDEELRQMMEALEVGDSVLTTSGFYGVVVDKVDETTIIVEFGNDKHCRIPMEKSAIQAMEKANGSSDDE